jgi:hypothetical protein
MECGISFRKINRWIQALLILLFLAVASVRAAATSIAVSWTANPDPGIIGYNVYSGNASQSYTKTTDAGNTNSAIINDLAEGRTYYFAVTSYNTIGLESLPSPEMAYAIPYATNVVRFTSNPITIQPKGQIGVSLSGPVGRTAVLLTSTNMTTWSAIATNTFTTTNLFIKITDTPSVTKTRFFRAKLL